MGVVAQPFAGRRYLHPVQPLCGFLQGLGRGQAFVDHQRFGHLAADGKHRVERGHGLLENHGNSLAPDLSDPFLAQVQKVLVLEKNLPLDLCRRAAQKLENGKGGHALPAPALADQPHGLPFKEIEVHPVHGIHDPVHGVEPGDQVPDREQRRSSVTHSLNLGSRASLKPSPRRLKLSTERKMAIPGKVATCGALNR